MGEVITVDFQKKEIVVPISKLDRHKKIHAEKMLELGRMTLFVNTDVSGVDLPDALMNGLVHLTLTPGPDGHSISVDNRGFHGELASEDGLFACHLPWECISGMASELSRQTLVFDQKLAREMGYRGPL